MSSEVTVTLGRDSRVVPVGTIVRDVLKDVPSKDLVAARVDGKVVDLTRKLDHDANVEPVLAETPEGLDVIRHSTAHLMAMAVQSLYPGTQVTIGPVIEDGFFYDFAPATPFTLEDLPKIEAKMRELAKADHKIHADRSPARGGRREILGDGREVQGRDNQRGRGSDFDLQPGRLDGSLPRTARALDAAT